MDASNTSKKVIFTAGLFMGAISLGTYKHLTSNQGMSDGSTIGMSADNSDWYYLVRHERSCVDGSNIVLYHDLTVGECADICAELDNCLGFEYGVNYGGHTY